MKKHTREDIITGKICPYCYGPSVYVDSSEIYSKSHGMIYLCRPCKAHVGVHDGTNTALGRLANSELRTWKQEAHLHFDKLWRYKVKQGFRKGHARAKAYKWLSKELGIPGKETHIGWFDVDLCQKVVYICKPYADKISL